MSNYNENISLNPEVWGPHYWFILYTMAVSYPTNPNEITKKKYYDFIQNLPLFIPNPNIGNNFSQFIDKYPVTPYLDSRESLTKWVHFIHNKINIYLGKPEVSFFESMNKYYDNYRLKYIKKNTEKKEKFKYIYYSLLISLLIIIIIIINKK